MTQSGAAPASARPLPVVIGGDLGSYSIARAFHRAFGLRSVVVAGVMTGAIRDSAIVRPRIEPRVGDDDELVRVIASIAADHDGRRLLVLGAADWHVEALVRVRDRLPASVVLPYAGADVIARATDKVAFGEACERLGVPYPETAVIRLDRALPALDDLPYPVVAKAASTSAFHDVEYPGKKKVFTADGPDELRAILEGARDGGYTAPFLVQRTVPGGDDRMRVATCFVARDGTVSDAVVGRVLLEEHTPGALGNPATIMVEDFPDVAAGMERLVAEFGWVGHANFDVKWDESTGEHVFFELNPRLGRSNFYLTASGTNPALALAREFLGLTSEPPPSLPPRVYSILPVPLVWWHTRDRAVRRRLSAFAARGRVAHPLWYPGDRSLRRWLYVQAAKLNQYRKYLRYYRPARDTMSA